MTERVCFTLNVRAERLEEYRSWHRSVWPEMTEALTRARWTNYSLFLRDDGLLIGYFETDSFDKAIHRIEQADVNRRWQEQMAPFFSLEEQSHLARARIIPIDEAFHLA